MKKTSIVAKHIEVSSILIFTDGWEKSSICFNQNICTFGAEGTLLRGRRDASSGLKGRFFEAEGTLLRN